MADTKPSAFTSYDELQLDDGLPFIRSDGVGGYSGEGKINLRDASLYLSSSPRIENYFADFATGGELGYLQMITSSTSGTGSNVEEDVSVGQETGCLGVLRLENGTTTNGTATVYFGNGNATCDKDGDVIMASARIRLQNYPSASQDYDLFPIAITDNPGLLNALPDYTTRDDFCGFVMNDTVGGTNWQFYYHDGTSAVHVDTGVARSFAWTEFCIMMYGADAEANGQIIAYIDGAEVVNVTGVNMDNIYRGASVQSCILNPNAHSESKYYLDYIQFANWNTERDAVYK